VACLKWAADHVLRRRGGAVAALSVTIVVGLSLYFACLYQDDFRVYLAGAHNLAGGTLYSRQTRGEFFTYPPFAALVFVSLEKIPSPIAAQIVWALLNDAALAALIACSIRAVRPDLPAGPRWLWASGLAGPAFFLDPVLLSIRHGQVNVLLAALTVWDLAGSRRIGPATVPRGVGTGVAAAIKLTPLIFLPYLVLTRRSGAAWRCAGVFALCEGIAFAVSPGPSAAYWTRYMFDYTRVGGYLRLGGLLATTNQNLMGALARFNHAPVPAGMLWAMAGLLGAAGLLLAALGHSRCSAFPGVIVCATTGLVISPVTWTHQMVWVLPAIVWLAAAPQRPRWGRAMAAATAVLFWAAPVWWVPNGNLRPLHENSWQLLAGNSFFAWMILFLGAIAASALWRTPIAAKTAEKPRPAGADSYRSMAGLRSVEVVGGRGAGPGQDGRGQRPGHHPYRERHQRQPGRARRREPAGAVVQQDVAAREDSQP
jgi:alpha-1,2-mannosyltransferase